MSRHRWKILAALIIPLGACASIDQTQIAAQGDWVGRSADEFFIANGAPVSEFPLSGGGMLAHWSSGVHSFGLPGSSNSTGYVVGDTVHVRTYESPPSAINTECQIDLNIDPAGKIVSLRVAKDTIGDWQFSRCREFLKLKIAAQQAPATNQ